MVSRNRSRDDINRRRINRTGPQETDQKENQGAEDTSLILMNWFLEPN